jgi:hypothetical protein
MRRWKDELTPVSGPDRESRYHERSMQRNISHRGFKIIWSVEVLTWVSIGVISCFCKDWIQDSLVFGMVWYLPLFSIRLSLAPTYLLCTPVSNHPRSDQGETPERKLLSHAKSLILSWSNTEFPIATDFLQHQICTAPQVRWMYTQDKIVAEESRSRRCVYRQIVSFGVSWLQRSYSLFEKRSFVKPFTRPI